MSDDGTVQLAIRLPAAKRQQFKLYAVRNGTSMGEVLNRAIDEVMAEEARRDRGVGRGNYDATRRRSGKRSPTPWEAKCTARHPCEGV